jgi:hypothetical protein
MHSRTKKKKAATNTYFAFSVALKGGNWLSEIFLDRSLLEAFQASDGGRNLISLRPMNHWTGEVEATVTIDLGSIVAITCMESESLQAARKSLRVK